MSCARTGIATFAATVGLRSSFPRNTSTDITITSNRGNSKDASNDASKAFEMYMLQSKVMCIKCHITYTSTHEWFISTATNKAVGATTAVVT